MTSRDADVPSGTEDRAVAEQTAILEAHRAANTGEALERKTRRQVEAWRHNRTRYPGWLVAPTENRRTLWNLTQEWVQPILDHVGELEPTEGLRWLRELTWRYDLCLLPLFPDHADAIRSVLLKVEPFRPSPTTSARPAAKPAGTSDVSQTGPYATDHAPVRPTAENLSSYDWSGLAQDWVALACSLLRHHREQADDEAFEELAARIETLPRVDGERSAFVIHQRCLHALERVEHGRARALIDGWVDGDGDPIWLVRKAGLMAELGDDRCEGVLRRALDVLRDTDASADRDDVPTLSREGWALYALGVLSPQVDDRRSDFRARFEALAAMRCDPYGVMIPLVTAVESRPTTASGSSRGTRFGSLPTQLQAHQARRLVEEVGYPMRFDIGVAGSEVIRQALPWIALGSVRDALPSLLRLGESRAVDDLLSLERVVRLADADVVRTARLALAAAAESMAHVARRSPRLTSTSTGPARSDGESLRRDTAERATRAALKVLALFAPRMPDEVLEQSCTVLIAMTAGGADGAWRIWGDLQEALRSCLAELSPERAGGYLVPVASMPLMGTDVQASPAARWDHDATFALWDAVPPGTEGGGRLRAQVVRLTSALALGTHGIARAQAMIRLIVLHRAGLLSPDETRGLADVVWQDAHQDAANAPAPERGLSGEGEPSRPRPGFPLPIRFLLPLPELHPGDATDAVRCDVLARPLPRFSVASEGGRPPSWRFGGGQNTDPLTDMLVATRKPWQEVDDRLPTIAWTTADAVAMLEKVTAWWGDEGLALWRRMREDDGPFQAMLPRWRFRTIVEMLAFVVLPAPGPDLGHLVRGSDLVRRMRAEGIVVELALPLLVAHDPATADEVSRSLRLSMVSRDAERMGVAMPAIFVWLDAARRGVVEPPPRDLVLEVASTIRARRGPALSAALRLGVVILSGKTDVDVGAVLGDIGIGLQYLFEETGHDGGESEAVGGEGPAALRLHASELLAAYARHVPSDDETLRLWLAGLDGEPIRSVRAALAEVREAVRERA